MRLNRRACVVALGVLAAPAWAQDENYPNRRAILVNTCPFIQLENFQFRNASDGRSTRFIKEMRWSNTGAQPIVAFEIVVLKYDAFDQRLRGTRWTVTGTNSADWRPLGPGGIGGDATRAYGAEEVMTAIAYVRQAKLADGTVWRVAESDLLRQLQEAAPGIKDFGSIRPDPAAAPKTAPAS